MLGPFIIMLLMIGYVRLMFDYVRLFWTISCTILHMSYCWTYAVSCYFLWNILYLSCTTLSLCCTTLDLCCVVYLVAPWYERSLIVRSVDGSILHRVDPLSYFSLQPVIHDWYNKDCDMYYPVCGMMHIKRTLAANRKE